MNCREARLSLAKGEYIYSEKTKLEYHWGPSCNLECTEPNRSNWREPQELNQSINEQNEPYALIKQEIANGLHS